MKKYIFTENQLKKVIDNTISEQMESEMSSHKKWWSNLDSDKKKNLCDKYFPENTFNGSNNEIKKMYDKEHEKDKKEFRPGFDLGKSFEKFKKEPKN